jgi:hypothetical protein
MVAALYTANTTTNIEAFKQEGDTFYLAMPHPDINTSSLAAIDTPETLPSVPSGIVVEALGRCVGGTSTNDVLLYTPPNSTTTPGLPNSFPIVPGYSLKILTPQTAYPYRLHTDTAQHIHAAAEGPGVVSLQCMTDGWVWNRGK